MGSKNVPGLGDRHTSAVPELSDGAAFEQCIHVRHRLHNYCAVRFK